MSDNVTPLHPERERQRRRRRKLLTLGGVVVLVLAVVALILFRDALNLDAVRRYFTYLGTEGDASYGQYQYEAHSNGAFAAYEDGLGGGPGDLRRFRRPAGAHVQRHDDAGGSGRRRRPAGLGCGRHHSLRRRRQRPAAG